MPRLAVTLWYFDRDEHARARRVGIDAEATDHREMEVTNAEMRRVEAQYGSKAVRYGEGLSSHDSWRSVV